MATKEADVMNDYIHTYSNTPTHRLVVFRLSTHCYYSKLAYSYLFLLQEAILGPLGPLVQVQWKGLHSPGNSIYYR